MINKSCMDKSANLGKMNSHSYDFLLKLYFLDIPKQTNTMPIAKTTDDTVINGPAIH